MKLTRQNKTEVKAGNVFRCGHSWLVTNVITAADKYKSPRSVSFTVMDMQDGRSIYASPSNEWYGEEIDEIKVEYTGGNIWLAFLLNYDKRHYYAVSSEDVDADNDRTLLYFDSFCDDSKFNCQSLTWEKPYNSLSKKEKLIYSFLLDAIEEKAF